MFRDTTYVWVQIPIMAVYGVLKSMTIESIVTVPSFALDPSLFDGPNALSGRS